MSIVGKAVRTIVFLNAFFQDPNCGESAVTKFARQDAARLLDDAVLRKAADKFLERCRGGEDLSTKSGEASFLKRVDDGIEASYPNSCKYYYSTEDSFTSMGKYPSDCKLKYRVFVTEDKDKFILAAQK